jgi:outer membrane lipoprotein-sorting protein
MAPLIGLITLAFFLSGFTPALALDAHEIMVKHEDARRIPSFTARASLVSEKADGTRKEKTFSIWRKLKENGVHFNSLTRFHAPAEVKNEAILFLENDKGENDILIYLPAYQKVRRIERSQQSASFMGSDFSYSDITTPHVDEYHHGMKGEEACPTDPSVRCYKIEAKPVSDAVRERTGYSRTLIWVRKDNFMIVRNDNYGVDDTWVKTSLLTEIEKQPSGKWFTKNISITSKKDGGKTTLHFSDVKTEVKIDPNLFTQQSLAKGGK